MRCICNTKKAHFTCTPTLNVMWYNRSIKLEKNASTWMCLLIHVHRQKLPYRVCLICCLPKYVLATVQFVWFIVLRLFLITLKKRGNSCCFLHWIHFFINIDVSACVNEFWFKWRAAAITYSNRVWVTVRIACIVESNWYHYVVSSF